MDAPRRTSAVLLAVFLASALARAVPQGEDDLERTAPGGEPLVASGRWYPPESVARRPIATITDTRPNLTILGVETVDERGDLITPRAGRRFFVRVAFAYANPDGTPYAIRRRVNGFAGVSPLIDLGAGVPGVSYWWHSWGAWVMHTGGTYSITAEVDGLGNVQESDETDNVMTVSFTVSGVVSDEWARVNAQAGLALLGDGTDVVVGTMDDAFDFTHPWFTGADSRGRPRLVAAMQNAYGPGGSPLNAAHATPVMGIVLARGRNGGDITGLAPDARFVTAEFINRLGPLPGVTPPHVFDAAGFLVQHGVHVINMSWSAFDDSHEALLGEGALSNLMADYLAYGRNIVCVAALNQIAGAPSPFAPAAARNVITVGGLKDNLDEAWERQNNGPTADGRCKPDLIGCDAVKAVAPSHLWRHGVPALEGYQGTSYSTPFVTGAVAQMLEFAGAQGLSRDHRLIKAVLMTGTRKAHRADGSPWAHTMSSPLDPEQGAGVLDLERVHAIYASPRTDLHGPVPGHVLGTVHGTASPPWGPGRAIYSLGRLTEESVFTATLAWDRPTCWDDRNQNGLIDGADDFHTDPFDRQDDLDLVLYRDGVVVAQSRSPVDTVEHLHVAGLPPGIYELHVERMYVPHSGSGETFGLAWWSDGVWVD